MYAGHSCRKLGCPFLRTLPKFQHKIPLLKNAVGPLLEHKAASEAAIRIFKLMQHLVVTRSFALIITGSAYSQQITL